MTTKTESKTKVARCEARFRPKGALYSRRCRRDAGHEEIAPTHIAYRRPFAKGPEIICWKTPVTKTP